MSESIDKATLIKQTSDWLIATRPVPTVKGRSVLLIEAGFDDQLPGRIEFEGSSHVFFTRLLSLLLNYNPLSAGKMWLTGLLKAVGTSRGIDHQSTIEGLISNVNAYSPSPGDVAGDREHITPAERPSLWIGVPDLPRYGLVGRDELITGLVNQLSTGTADSLSAEGKPGVGKTALAVALAHRRDLLAHFRDGVLWAGLGPDGDPLTALSRWATAVGVDPAAYADPYDLKQAIKDAIGQRVILLVIDDIWQQKDADLLHCGGPFCAHFLTTRDLIIAHNFSKEVAVTTVPELEANTAFTLLQTIAPKACEANPALARDLALAVGGLPLAIELLGGYLAQSAGAIRGPFRTSNVKRLQELQDPAQRLQLAQARLGGAAKEKELQEVIALSLDGAPVEVQDVYYALGAFAPKPANFSLQAAVSVAQTDEEPLEWLVQRNLLDVVILPDVAEEQLALHQVLADLARARMDKEAQARHTAFYLALVNEDRQDWQRIDAVYEQLRWAWDRLDDDAFLDWIYALRQHQVTRGYWKESIEWQKRGLAWTRARDEREDEAKLLNNLAWTYDDLGRRTEALRLYEEALPIMREVGDRGGEATTLNNMGAVYEATGRPAEALRLYEEALPIMREVGDRGGEATTLNNMGGVYEATGRPAEALRLYEEALPIRREVGDRGGEAATLNNMALVYEATGRPAEALRLYEEALPIRREVGDRGGEATTLNNMGAVYEATGRPAEALRLYEEALPIMREVGDRGGEATTLNNMGAVYEATGRPAEALRLYEEALPIMREVGDRGGEATTLWNVAMLLEQLERTPEAIERVKEAIALFRGGLTHDSASDSVEGYEAFLAKLQAG